MIDDYKKAMVLMDKIKKELPISVKPTRQLVRSLRENGIKIKIKQIIRVESVLYLGDDGGIGCEIKYSQNQESPVISSLTHVQIQSKHPLAKEIRAYQKRTEKELITKQLNNEK